MRRVAVWGTGNMGATAIRSTVAFSGLQLVGVITSSPDKAGTDARRVVQPRKARGAQGAFWLKIIGSAAGCERIVIDHITRIDPACAPDWPQPDEGVGDHRVIVDGDPQLNIVVRADVPGGTRTDGGNTTAANRLLGAIEWLATQKAGIYDGLDVPLHPPLPAEVEAQRWSFR